VALAPLHNLSARVALKRLNTNNDNATCKIDIRKDIFFNARYKPTPPVIK